MSNINYKNKKGISVLYVVFIASILLAIGLGISGILIQQIKTLGEIGHSVAAFYAADSGIERVLMAWQAPELEPDYYSCYSLSSPACSLANGATYRVFVLEGGGVDCSLEFTFCIKSIGTYKKTSRAIKINY